MKCPGQDTRFWGLDAIFEEACPKCGATLEFFRDDTWRTCKKCGERVQNPRMNFGCAAHCPYAEQCIGSLPPELLAQKDGDLKDRLAVAAKKLMAGNFKLLSKTLKLARRAEELGKKEGASMAPLLAAAYFLPYLQMILETEGLLEEAFDRVRAIMEENGASKDLSEEASKILKSALEIGQTEGPEPESSLLKRALKEMASS